jgi:hypothetical protein
MMSMGRPFITLKWTSRIRDYAVNNLFRPLHNVHVPNYSHYNTVKFI